MTEHSILTHIVDTLSLVNKRTGDKYAYSVNGDKYFLTLESDYNPGDYERVTSNPMSISEFASFVQGMFFMVVWGNNETDR